VETFGRSFHPDEALIIGDTPRDVACGLAHGVRTVAVATGSFDAGALAEAGAHRVVEDFRDTDALVELLLD
jgi:phosphoglycolate phosphatase-like HAD superfamily hydrolase